MTRARPSGGPPIGFGGQVLPAPGASPMNVRDVEDENQLPEDSRNIGMNSANRYDANQITGDASFISVGTTGK